MNREAITERADSLAAYLATIDVDMACDPAVQHAAQELIALETYLASIERHAEKLSRRSSL